MIDTGLPGEILRLALRWAHVVAAIAWIGGAIFYLTVLRPALREASPDERSALEPAMARYFREVVQIGVLVLLISGVVLSVDRLSTGVTGPAYVTVLAVKVALSLLTFWLAWDLARRGRRAATASNQGPLPPACTVPGRQAPPNGGLTAWLHPPRLTLVLGLLLVLLGLLLRALVEEALRSPA